MRTRGALCSRMASTQRIAIASMPLLRTEPVGHRTKVFIGREEAGFFYGVPYHVAHDNDRDPQALRYL